MLNDGSILVNSVVAKPGQLIDPDQDVITNIQGDKLVRTYAKPTYILFNKPGGYITSRFDPHEKFTIYDVLPKEFNVLFPIGRLDKDTEGLLILTNDGDLSYKLTHPKFEIEKEYYVLLDKELDENVKRKIEHGLNTKEIQTSTSKINIIKNQGGRTYLNIILHEGQKREIKRMFQAFGYTVNYLKRIRVGSLLLGDLAPSEWRNLEKDEVLKLLS
jgi:pseudouridine synthase